MIAPYAAGGGLHAVARIMALALSEQLGQSVAVDNRRGAGGTIGANTAAKAPLDCYTSKTRILHIRCRHIFL
jgi:tripartite-type tricarboxylate transporter receptor subunit TctC